MPSENCSIQIEGERESECTYAVRNNCYLIEEMLFFGCGWQNEAQRQHRHRAGRTPEMNTKRCWSENGLQLSFVILNFFLFSCTTFYAHFISIRAVQIFITLLWICHHKWKRLFLWPAFKYLKFVFKLFHRGTFSVIVFFPPSISLFWLSVCECAGVCHCCG